MLLRSDYVVARVFGLVVSFLAMRLPRYEGDVCSKYCCVVQLQCQVVDLQQLDQHHFGKLAAKAQVDSQMSAEHEAQLCFSAWSCDYLSDRITCYGDLGILQGPACALAVLCLG